MTLKGYNIKNVFMLCTITTVYSASQGPNEMNYNFDRNTYITIKEYFLVCPILWNQSTASAHDRKSSKKIPPSHCL